MKALKASIKPFAAPQSVNIKIQAIFFLLPGSGREWLNTHLRLTYRICFSLAGKATGK